VDRELAALGAVCHPLPEEERPQVTARLLATGKVVGWFQGRMEFGPRALGARSILADHDIREIPGSDGSSPARGRRLAPHQLILPKNTPMADLNAPGCGWQVIQSFLSDPTKAPDTSCIAGMAPLDFANPPPEWLALVGIKDLWENP
jgi:hypothetical protein